MPCYLYRCDECFMTFEKLMKMSEMEVPLSNPCPECGIIGGVVQQLTSASFGDPIRFGHKKPDAGWGDVLSKVKSAHPGGNWSNQKFVPQSGR